MYQKQMLVLDGNLSAESMLEDAERHIRKSATRAPQLKAVEKGFGNRKADKKAKGRHCPPK